MWSFVPIIAVIFLSGVILNVEVAAQYSASGSPDSVGINGGSTRGQAPVIELDAVNVAQGTPGINVPTGQLPNGGSIDQGRQQIGIGQDGITRRFGQPGIFGQTGFRAPGISSGQSGVIGGRGAGVGGSQRGTRVVQAPVTPTVTKTVTLDHFVTLTDLAFHSVPVTLTDLVVRTTTVTSRQVIHTPIDDRVALRTSVVIRPTSVTVTCTKYDYRIATEVSVDYVTIVHNSYVISQRTYTTTATQIVTYPATMVRTIVRTQRTTVTDYRTITNVIHGYGAY